MSKKYDVITSFPVDETDKGKKHTSTKRTVSESEIEATDVADLYNEYLESDYKVSISFKVPEGADDEDAGASPFDTGKSLAKQGIEYKATLKIATKGSYEDMHQAMKLVASNGYDLTANVQLKENDKTDIDLERTSTWNGDDAVFKLTPKASSKDVMELKSLYDSLQDAGYETEITIKPKMPKGDEALSDPKESFMTQLKAYPDGTTVKFNLTEPTE